MRRRPVRADDGPLVLVKEGRVIVDLFAGPGGWDEGLASLGVTDVVGLEWDTAACLTAQAAGHLRVQADVAQYPTAAFVGADGLIASPPCPSFSSAGRGAGRDAMDQLLAHAHSCADGWVDPPGAICAEDVRADLTLQPLRWADALRPRWVALEQVPPVLPLWTAMGEVLRGWGYSTWAGVLNAANYGVPQTRQRAFLLARTDAYAEPPSPTHAKHPGVSLLGETQPWVTMAQALGWDGEVDRRTNSKAAGWSKGAPMVPTVTVPTSRPAPSLTAKGAAGQWVLRRPATTVVGSFRPDVIAAPGWRSAGDGPRQNAEGSMQVEQWELGVLQGFRPDYPWQGTKTKQGQQVGNAVPPPLAAAVLEVVVADRGEVAA